MEVLPRHHSETNRDGKTINYYQIRNNSDLYFELERTAGNGPARIVLHPQSSQVISAEAGQPVYDVVSTYIRSDKHLSVNLPLR